MDARATLDRLLELLPRVGPFGLPMPAVNVREALQGIPRGMSADLLGAPADVSAQLLTLPRMLGLNTPDFRQSPTLGSDHLGSMLEGIGVLSPATGSNSEGLGRALGGLLAPQTMAGAQTGLAAALRNAQAPGPSSSTLGRQLGAINPREAKYMMPNGKLVGSGDATHESIAGKSGIDGFMQQTGAIRMNIAADMVSGKPYTLDIAAKPTQQQMAGILDYIASSPKPVTVYTPTDVVQIAPGPKNRVAVTLNRLFPD